MERFAVRPEIWYGTGALAALEKLAGKRVLLVTDGFLAASGLATRAAERLTGPVEVFDRVEPDPSLQLVAEGVAALEHFQPDVVVAFGGGSPMDCAKAMCWFSRCRPPLWCIPTTAGTGSEVTSFAVLTDTEKGVKHPLVEEGLLPETAILDPALLEGVPPKVTAETGMESFAVLTDTEKGVKHPLVEEGLLPETAILDPALLEGVPPKVTAETGMDVLTHAAETYVAAGSSPFSDALAEKSFSLAYDRLPTAFAGDLGAKGDMLLASCLAGMAFNAAGLGACHAMAHALGGQFHLPHGRLNAILLPMVVLRNAGDRRAATRYAALAKACGLSGTPRALSAGLVRLRAALDLPDRLPVEGGALRSALDDLSAAALADGCMAANPLTLTAAEIRDLLARAGGLGGGT